MVFDDNRELKTRHSSDTVRVCRMRSSSTKLSVVIINAHLPYVPKRTVSICRDRFHRQLAEHDGRNVAQSVYSLYRRQVEELDWIESIVDDVWQCR
jgi:hypothetical protein